MSKSILGLIIAVFLSFSVRAEQPTFNITSLDADPGQVIDINFNVDNFSQLISVQFSVNWDPAVLQFRTIKNFNPSVPGLSPSVFGATPAMTDNGHFTLGWIESSITPITIPDGSLFFTVEFEVIGDPCDNSPVAITNTPLEIEVAEDDEDVGLIANNGEVSVPGAGCAQTIIFTGNSITGPCGGNSCIQFTVDNFTDVVAMEYSLIYNPAVLQFDEFRNFAPLSGFNVGSTNLAAPGILRVVWTNSNVENESLPDGTVMFEICFDIIGTGGQSSQITFGAAPPVLFANVDSEEYPFAITPAMITAQCQLEGFALIVEPDTMCFEPNSIKCFDVQVNDFDDIIAMQFSMNWDSNLFVFDHVEGFGIPGLDDQAFGVPINADVDEGELTVVWIDLSLEGVTVPDFTTIFKLCLRAIGPAGSNSPITFSSNPLEIEVATLDSVLVYSLVNGRGEIRSSCIGCDISYTLTSTNPDCPRETNGSLNLTVTEDCPETPTYLWSFNNATTEDLSNLGAGTYTVTITVGSQIIVASGVVSDPPSIAVTATTTDPSPISACNGSVNINVTGGTPPYTYQWSTPPGGTSEDLLNILCAGTYAVTVTDSKGCTFIPDSYVLGAEVSAAVTNVFCNGGSDGAINLSASFGTGPYTYSWNTIPVSTTEDISNLTARQYCVTITDNTGSTRDTCFNVTQPLPFNVNASITHDVNINCQGAIDLSVTGGTMPYTYNWSNGATTQDIIQLCAGQYCVTITDGQDCTVDTCFSIFAGGLGVNLTVTQYGDYQTSCPGNNCDGEIFTQVGGGTGPYTYQWSLPPGGTTADLQNLCAGTYTVTVTDASGQTATSSTVITSPPPFTFSFITTKPSDFLTSNGAISVVVNGGSPPYTYQWTGAGQGNTAALNNVPAGTYILEITDANGCVVTDAEQLLPDVDVPCYSGISVITPNSDGANDYFIISCVLDFDNHLYIFNRQGGLVYETDNYQNTWIGINQDGEALPDGGYLWVLEVFRPNGSTELIKGTVNLLRTAD